ncbi:MAG: hypothetical protein H0W71_09670 [Sphingomonas sp.]|nr:hypothetical protein [Sphingomonas sp.]
MLYLVKGRESVIQQYVRFFLAFVVLTGSGVSASPRGAATGHGQASRCALPPMQIVADPSSFDSQRPKLTRGRARAMEADFRLKLVSVFAETCRHGLTTGRIFRGVSKIVLQNQEGNDDGSFFSSDDGSRTVLNFGWTYLDDVKASRTAVNHALICKAHPSEQYCLD